MDMWNRATHDHLDVEDRVAHDHMDVGDRVTQDAKAEDAKAEEQLSNKRWIRWIVTIYLPKQNAVLILAVL